ncbi:MAG: hypothetical protein CL677_02425 [Bdellovibrionaceae bacterium]|nr:hypothetical protein [Pseudobdellovibrionaceae bacterium]|tara:strand:+ start:13247 stop:15145 length:1899 start_codon:yes stop_codon:yes gene_type:complete
MSTFNPEEEKIVLTLVGYLTGNTMMKEHRKKHMLTAVNQRITKVAGGSLRRYLYMLIQNESELLEFLSSTTIHTTFWFRERPHFRTIEQDIKDRRPKHVKIWSAGCSSGQEVYSLALMLENIKKNGFREMTYHITGSDIDRISIKKAKKGHYPIKEKEKIPKEYHSHLITDGDTFTFKKEIMRNTAFVFSNLLNFEKFDLIKESNYVLCRNVLIYFTPQTVVEVVNYMGSMLADQGHLFLGHSEFVIEPPKKLVELGGNKFCRDDSASASQRASEKLENIKNAPVRNPKVLVIEDSKAVSELIKKHLTAESFDVTVADTGEAADSAVKQGHFDIITLDLNLPDTHGLDWLKKQRKMGLKTNVIVVSEIREDEASQNISLFDYGVQDYIEKGSLNEGMSILVDSLKGLTERDSGNLKSQNLTTRKVLTAEQLSEYRSPQLIVMGGSTGAIPVFQNIFTQLPEDCPPIVLVQHINQKFAGKLYDTLLEKSALKTAECRDGETLKRGYVYMAKDYRHVAVEKTGSRQLSLSFSTEDPKFGHKPSVDHLFRSAAKINIPMAAVILTGMGKDGSEALGAIQRKGHFTVAQDQQSSAVFGMPGEAVNKGFAEAIASPLEISQMLKTLINPERLKKKAS